MAVRIFALQGFIHVEHQVK